MLNNNVSVIDLSSHSNPAEELGNELEDFLTTPDLADGNPNLIRYRNRLNNGGTLIRPEVTELSRQHVGLANQIGALKNRLGHPQDAPITLKAYRSRVSGLAAHRDANFRDAGPATVVDAIGLRGAREFALWAVPQTVELDSPDSQFMHNANRAKAIVEFLGYLDGRAYKFRPVRTHTFGAGQGVRIDEKNGEWYQPSPSDRQMAVWHSVYAQENEDGRPVLSAVIRSRNPRKLPATR